MRTIVDLPEHQIEALAGLCEREGISRAEAIRRAVRMLLAANWEADLAAAFGAWRDKDIDGAEYQRTIRAEWDQ